MSIQEFYAGKSVLITGGTGFIGRFLVYRLLSTCNVSKIYVLVRPRHGVTFEERQEKFAKEPIFKHLPDVTSFNKVHVIQGELRSAGLGLAPADLQTLANDVSIVFHCAASIRLTQNLKEATCSNLYGTLNVLGVAKSFTKVQSFIFASSIANWFYKTCLEEKIYDDEVPFFTDPHSFVKKIQDMSATECDEYSAQHVGTWPKYPNNYSFTKTLTEVMLKREKCNFNIGIVRSPLLFSCLKLPEAGWVDTPQAGTAMFSLFANGLLRTARFDPDYDFNHMPLDMCVNALITSGWYMAEKCEQSCEVFNMNCSRGNPISIREVSVIASKLGHEFPSMKQVRPPKNGLMEKPNPIFHRICSFFTHTLFFLLMDLFLWVSGHKPVFMKIMSKALDGMSEIEKILRIEADVVSDKLTHVYDKILSPADKQLFYYDPKEIDWLSLLTSHHLRFRRVFLREDPANMDDARDRMKIVTLIYTLVTFIPPLIVTISIVLLMRYGSSWIIGTDEILTRSLI